MKRPEVKLENYQAVYDFYKHYRSPRLAYQIGHRAMAAVYRPDVHYAPGAQDVIANHLQTGTRLILASNHVNNQDQYIVAAMAQREKVLRPMRGRTFIPAKESLFQNPLLRLGVDFMGAIPTFRQKDVSGTDSNDETANAKQALQRSAASRLLGVSVQRITSGDHIAIFPEGTRNTGDVTQVQPAKRGISVIVGGLEDIPVALVPTGIFYGQGDDFDKRRPTVFVDIPLGRSFLQSPSLLTDIQTSLQSSLDQAISTRNAT
jgi:1-acyl-sn-glycerol-3-phosphate acyltransferase